jgi:hypothetical protein
MSALRDLVAEEVSQPVDPRVRAMAAAVAAKYGQAARAVLFYGSCLREKQLDGLMLDFYLIVSTYREAYGPGWLAAGNRIVPPNVFPFQDRVIGAVARAVPTLLGAALPTAKPSADPLDLWRHAFALTYSAELRAERKARSGSVVDSDPDRYRRFTAAGLAEAVPNTSSWRRRRLEGKLLSVARLAKASATYAGGAEYIAWKINRHAGTEIVLKPWQKRWPLLAAISLLPRLLRSGAVR